MFKPITSQPELITVAAEVLGSPRRAKGEGGNGSRAPPHPDPIGPTSILPPSPPTFVSNISSETGSEAGDSDSQPAKGDSETEEGHGATDHEVKENAFTHLMSQSQPTPSPRRLGASKMQLSKGYKRDRDSPPSSSTQVKKGRTYSLGSLPSS